MIKFLSAFCIMFYGTIAWIGIASPEGGYYSPFVHKYLDYVTWLRSLLLHASMFFLQLLGYHIYLSDAYTLKMRNGSGVHVGYDCIGYGVMIFWMAFIFANKIEFRKKIRWLFGGLLAIWTINVLRISLLLIAINHHWPLPFNMNNHTLFNIAAYLLIFIMIYFFDRSEKNKLSTPGVLTDHKKTVNAGQ